MRYEIANTANCLPRNTDKKSIKSKNRLKNHINGKM